MPTTQTEGKRSIISCKKFVPENVSITALDTQNERIQTQAIAYVHYQFKPNVRPENLIFQTGDIKLTEYGIPELGDFAKEDKDRQYVKIPFDMTQPACVELCSMLEKFDKYVLSCQETIFGKTSKLYKYIPLVRDPVKLSGEELEEKKILYLKKTGKAFIEKDLPRYCKIKFDIDYDTKQLETAIYDSTSPDEPPKEIDVSTITELTHHVRWQSTIKMIVMANKLWAQKTAKSGSLREFGISLKCLVLHVKERAQTAGGTVKDLIRSGQIDFVDDDIDDNDNDDENVIQTKKVVVVNKPVNNHNDDNDDNDDDDENDDNDEDENDDNHDNDDNDEDDEDSPPPPVTPKVVPKVAPKPVTTVSQKTAPKVLTKSVIKKGN
jgi:hypothetical protein